MDGTKRKEKMQLKVSVISDRPDEYIGKKGLVKSQIITCQDVDPSGYARFLRSREIGVRFSVRLDSYTP
jgi:hypothetical protein